MSEIIDIGSRTKTVAEEAPEINQDAIALVEVLLGKLRSGEVQGVAVAYDNHDDDGGTFYSSAGSLASLLGCVCVVQTRLIEAMR